MNIEKLSDRTRGFIQSAQTNAIGAGHQQFTPEHILKALLDDPDGLAAGLMTAAGARPKEAHAAVERALGKLPKVDGSGAGDLRLVSGTVKVLNRWRRRRATRSSPSSGCCWRSPPSLRPRASRS